MAKNEGSTSAQSQQIDTSQPTPLKGLKIRGVKKVATVRVKHPVDDDRIMVINKADYDEEKHGPIVEEKLPVRKKAKKKAKKNDDK